jgi:hypothetical protein
MKKISKFILIKISRVISKIIMIIMGVKYFLTPIEYRYKKSPLEKKLEEILI